MYEIMRKYNFKESINQVEQEILHMVMPGNMLSFEDVFKQKAMYEARVKIDDPTSKYSRAIAHPSQSGLFTRELLRAKRVNEREYFKTVCSIGEIEGVSYQEYQKILQGERSRKNTSEIRGRFARASVQYEEDLLSSLTSDDMRTYLLTKLYRAILKDYHDLVWQSEY